MHNGYVDGFAKIKRDLAFAVDPSLYAQIGGTTDSELLFYLALTFGLEDDPPEAVAKAIGLVEAAGLAAGIDRPFQGTVVTSDGETMWAFRYSSDHKSQTLFFNRDVPTLRREYPQASVLSEVSDDTRLVVSEPIGNLPGAWVEVPEATFSVVRKGYEELRPFTPVAPA
jgi:glutamine amidotransferase